MSRPARRRLKLRRAKGQRADAMIDSLSWFHGGGAASPGLAFLPALRSVKPSAFCFDMRALMMVAPLPTREKPPARPSALTSAAT
ncbi:unnamed protein product, partial [Prorocentrum cordatum]